MIGIVHYSISQTTNYTQILYNSTLCTFRYIFTKYGAISNPIESLIIAILENF